VNLEGGTMLEGLAPKNKDHICALMQNAAETLEEKDFQILMDALVDTRFSNNGLAEALTERGFKATETQVRRHRVKKCACNYAG
jgi:hypothetical protein